MFRFVTCLIFCCLFIKAEEISFNRDIRPILSENCFACHGFDAKHRKAEMRLDTPEGAFGKAESGAEVIQPGNALTSELWKRIIATDREEIMPPPKSHKSLSKEQKELIRRWIDAGAPYEKHWSFVAPVRPKMTVSAGENPIDALITSQQQPVGLQLSPEADRETLLRRLSFDLTGLPPTIEEMQKFLADLSPGAYERQVDRLLASPGYGEQMAVGWLDLARYGDTNGYLHDILRTGWPWRDWVIKAYQEDMPFDRFVTEQIAGDLLPNATPEQILATSFNRNHLITTEGGTIAAEYLNEYAADRVQTFGTVFLGLTMNCCRCHDHKYDPLTQDDFYSLQSYFNSTTEIHAENNKASAFPPLIEIASPLHPDGAKANVMVMQEAAQMTPTFILTRGQYDQPDPKRPVTRHVPKILGEGLTESAKNRLGLAQWLVSPQNPLLARVTMNRLWQQFFGKGLVKSADDFGVQGDFPSHPLLLDWLAEEFRLGDGQSSPWSQRHMVRLIVTSKTYRQSSHLAPEVASKDPDNRLLTHFPRQRLSAEQIRDQALYHSGLMNGEIGGPPVFPYQPAGLWEERSNGSSNTKSYRLSKGSALYRRSLYTFWKRTSPPALMAIFDAPDRTSCLVHRAPTNTPLQALAMLNDEHFLECAKWIAVRTMQESNTNDDRLSLMFRRITSRTPAEADLWTLQEGFNGFLARYQENPLDAAELLKQGATAAPVELNAPELAAWMMVASVILNLDETLVRD